MGIYSGSYSRVSGFQPKPIYAQPSIDLYVLFEIINPARGHVTCIGHAPSKGRRCQWAISGVNQQYTKTMLRKLSNQLAQGLPSFEDLEDVAGAALCQRYHQGQANAIARKWQRLINDQYQTAFVQPEMTPLDILRGILENARMGGDMSYLQDLRYLLRVEEQRMQQEQQRAQADAYRQEHENREWVRKQNEENARRERERIAREEEEKRRREAKRQQERERIERERRQAEEREKKEKEEKARAEAERKKQEEKAKEQKKKALRPWSEAWDDYLKAFEKFQEGKTKSIPWPVRSGRLEDVTDRSVDIFYREGPPDKSPAELFKLMNKENLKWHKDKTEKVFSGLTLNESEEAAKAAVSRVVIELRREFQEKRSRRDSHQS